MYDCKGQFSVQISFILQILEVHWPYASTDIQANTKIKETSSHRCQRTAAMLQLLINTRSAELAAPLAAVTT